MDNCPKEEIIQLQKEKMEKSSEKIPTSEIGSKKISSASKCCASSENQCTCGEESFFKFSKKVNGRDYAKT